MRSWSTGESILIQIPIDEISSIGEQKDGRKYRTLKAMALGRFVANNIDEQTITRMIYKIFNKLARNNSDNIIERINENEWDWKIHRRF